jgi:hypothetical protein
MLETVALVVAAAIGLGLGELLRRRRAARDLTAASNPQGDDDAAA